MATEVPATRAPLAARDVALALDAAFRAAGAAMPIQAIELFTVLTQVETGGHATCNNVGNLSAGGFYNGAEHINYPTYWRPPWYSVSTDNAKLLALHDRMLKGTAPSAFRAYQTVEAGIADFVGLIVRKFGNLVDAARSGDVHEFRLALDTGYSPDYTEAHERTFTSLVNAYRANGVFDGITASDDGGSDGTAPKAGC